MTLSAPALEATGSPVMVLIVKLFPVPVDPTHRMQDWKKVLALKVFYEKENKLRLRWLNSSLGHNIVNAQLDKLNVKIPPIFMVI